MAHNVIALLADGFEESEALVPVDLLRRVGDNVLLISIKDNDLEVTSSHNVRIIADDLISNVNIEQLDGVFLPGGMPGTKNLDACPAVHNIIDRLYAEGKLISAICAAPMILGKKGLLDGRNATCFPGFEQDLKGATVLKQHAVADGNIITGKGAGAAFELGLAMVEFLHDEETANKLAETIQFII